MVLREGPMLECNNCCFSWIGQIRPLCFHWTAVVQTVPFWRNARWVFRALHAGFTLHDASGERVV